jgi:hypothetical protein
MIPPYHEAVELAAAARSVTPVSRLAGRFLKVITTSMGRIWKCRTAGSVSDEIFHHKGGLTKLSMSLKPRNSKMTMRMTTETYTSQDFAWSHIMRNIDIRQDGLCRQCGKPITLKDSVVARRSTKPRYYHLECAEILNII